MAQSLAQSLSRVLSWLPWTLMQSGLTKPKTGLAIRDVKWSSLKATESQRFHSKKKNKQTSNIFCPHYTGEFKNPTITDHFGFVLEENLVMKSYGYWNAIIFKKLHFGDRFSVDSRSNCRNEDAFLCISCVVWILPWSTCTVQWYSQHNATL